MYAEAVSRLLADGFQSLDRALGREMGRQQRGQQAAGKSEVVRGSLLQRSPRRGECPETRTNPRLQEARSEHGNSFIPPLPIRK